MNKLLIASCRKGKLDEVFGALSNLKIKLLTLEDINFPKIKPKEIGKNFIENAIIKAKFYGKKTGLLTLADDSGLQVKALPHKLGVNTKRYLQGSDQDRWQKLLKEMIDVSETKRQAQFVSAVALFNPKTNELNTAKGVCKGEIARYAKGNHGFGYDPIFMVTKLNKHFAELTLEEKNRVSHRGHSLKKIKKYLKKYMSA